MLERRLIRHDCHAWVPIIAKKEENEIYSAELCSRWKPENISE